MATTESSRARSSPARARSTTRGRRRAPRQAATVILLRGGARGARGAARQAHAGGALHGRRVGVPRRRRRRGRGRRRRRPPRGGDPRAARGGRDRARRPRRAREVLALDHARRRCRSASTRTSSSRRCPPARSRGSTARSASTSAGSRPRRRSTPTAPGRSRSCSRRSSTSNSSSDFASVDELLAYARGRDVQPVEPRVVLEGEVARILLPGEPGY